MGRKAWRELTFDEKKALYEDALAKEISAHKFASKTRLAKTLGITRQALYDFIDLLDAAAKEGA